MLLIFCLLLKRKLYEFMQANLYPAFTVIDQAEKGTISPS